MIIQARCFNCDRLIPIELNSSENVVILVCLNCKPKLIECFNYNMKADPDMGEKKAILDILNSIAEDGPL